jgi:hypothetical protein
MPILNAFVDKAFRKPQKKRVYENEHLLYDIVRGYFLCRSYFVPKIVAAHVCDAETSSAQAPRLSTLV